jgi:glutamate racemase
VPAIKPACATSQSKLVSVLGTEATVAREYTRTLIAEYAQGCSVTLVSSHRLAVAGWANPQWRGSFRHRLAEEIKSCFVEKDDARTDTIALACTHYPILIDRLKALAPGRQMDRPRTGHCPPRGRAFGATHIE